MKQLFFIIFALMSLSVAFACHASCICDEGSQICSKCKYENIGAVMDKYQRSCPCPLGYYTSSRNPFTCSELLISNTKNDQQEDEGEKALQEAGLLPEDNGEATGVATGQEQQDNEQIQKEQQQLACKKECQIKTRSISVKSNCYNIEEDGKTYIVSDVSLNLENISMTQECWSYFEHKIQFLNPTTNGYENLDSKYIVIGSNGSLQIKIPLIDVYELSSSQSVGDEQIAQQINIMSLIGTDSKIYKKIKWAICVYTNRTQVQIFQFDVDIQTTEQECTDCVIIVDLDTVATVYQDETFAVEKNAPYSYFVGDTFYAKITFADTSFTKYLKFVSLLYKNDLGQIYDYSSITVHSWENHGLTIALPLAEPSSPALIQILMKVDPTSGGRFLQQQDELTQKATLIFDILKQNNEPDKDKNQEVDQDKNVDQIDQDVSSSLLFFGLNLLLIIISLV